MIKRVKRSNPYDGEWLLIGHLAQEGINVPTARVRASIHRVDPINTELRTSITVIRRVHYAAGPNAIWHMDDTINSLNGAVLLMVE